MKRFNAWVGDHLALACIVAALLLTLVDITIRFWWSARTGKALPLWLGGWPWQ